MLTVKKYQSSIFGYVILIQTSFILAASFIFYIIYIYGELLINKILNHICASSILDSTKTLICPSFLVKENLNSWKSEISRNKIIHPSHGRHSFIINRLQLGDLVETPTALSDFNKTSANEFDFSKSTGNIYLFLISVSLVNFFICLVIPLLLIKSNRQSKKIIKGFPRLQNTNDQVEEKILNESTNDNKIDIKTNINNEQEYKSENDFGGYWSSKRVTVRFS